MKFKEDVVNYSKRNVVKNEKIKSIKNEIKYNTCISGKIAIQAGIPRL
jgi:hypothetical protein